MYVTRCIISVGNDSYKKIEWYEYNTIYYNYGHWKEHIVKQCKMLRCIMNIKKKGEKDFDNKKRLVAETPTY